MKAAKNETIQSLYEQLGIDTAHTSPSLESLAATDSRFLRDLKLNVAGVIGSASFSRKEAYLLALSVSINEKNAVLIPSFSALAMKEGATEEEIAEIHACTAVMNVNNIFYRFRHYLSDTAFYEKQPAGIRMSVMMNPILGKEFFELASLVISSVNGCERCVTAHERSVREHGASEQRVYDAIRLAAVIKSLCMIL